MNEEYRGRLTSRKTKKGYHIEINYERKGKSKKISFHLRNFPGEFHDLEILFVLKGNRVTKIKKTTGETIWEQEPGRPPRDTMRKPSKRRANESVPQTREPQNLNLKVHRDTERFIKVVGYRSSDFNPALKFNKFLEWDRNKQKFDYEMTLGVNHSGIHLQEFTIPSEVKKRINTLQSPSISGALVIPWRAKTTWRMIIGLGSPHVHETAMTWHHTWSIPYIPGSALKGVTRSWFLLTRWEEFAKNNPEKADWESTIPCLEAWFMDNPYPKEKDVDHKEEDCPVFPWAKDKLENDSQLFKLLFGTQKQKGAVIFMDAFPVNKYTLKLDVMNVHYPKYYRGESSHAADWESPNPVFYLTVVNTQFQGVIIVNKRFFNKLEKTETYTAERLADEAIKLVKDALENQGIGARTSVGYGFMEIFK